MAEDWSAAPPPQTAGVLNNSIESAALVIKAAGTDD